MKPTQRVRLFLVGLMALLIVAAVPSALAATPVIIRTEINDTFPFTRCAFPIEGHVTGIDQEALYLDAAGNLVRVIATFPRWRLTFTNLETGKSISTASPDPVKTQINADGSFTITIAGLQGHFSVPGQGTVVLDVGRVVIFFDGPEDENPDVI